LRSARLRAFAAALFVLSLSGCGYRVAGKADLLPKNLRSIAVPAFGNSSARYKLSEKLAAQITRELLSRTRYDVVSEPGDADAVLSGSVNNYSVYPTVFDPATGRASIVQVSVNLSITLRERATNKVLYSRQSFEVRERYEISTDQRAYVEESDTAMDRLSRDVARSVVSAVLENF
jgi:outer membrane lipopolysaccharide assembly protein LptE/RlpB